MPRRKILLVLAFLCAALLAGALASYGDPLMRLFHGVRPGVHLEGRPVGGLYPDEVRGVVLELARRRYRAPVNASLDRATGAVIPHAYGRRVDVEATMKRVIGAGWNEHVNAVLVVIPPRWTAADLSRLTRTGGEFSTWVFGSRGRRANIRLAVERLGHVLLLPGREFSFNAAVGPYTPEVGWHNAPVAIEGQLVPGLGGGICQVSTTLYNAARAAALTITERHHHSVGVPYVPPGADAAVSHDKDLRFRNDHPFPARLRMSIENGRLWARVHFPEEAPGTPGTDPVPSPARPPDSAVVAPVSLGAPGGMRGTRAERPT